MRHPPSPAVPCAVLPSPSRRRQRVGALRSLHAAGLELLALLPALGAGAAAQSTDAPVLPDTFAARVEALASMASLEAAILGSRSATATLEAWCASHDLAEPPRITALRDAGPERPPSEEQRRRLLVGPDEPVRHRRVRLACGARVLSEADNWYVPSRLTPAMNAALDGSDAPYGKVVAPLAPTRRTFEARTLWQVLPPGWELHPPHDDHPGRRLDVPAILFEHRALVLDGAGRPLSEVDERYLAAALAFAPTR